MFDQLNSSRIQYFLSSQIFFYDLIFNITTMSEINFCTGLISNLEQEWSDTAAAAKSLQLCLTLSNPHRQQPTRLCHLWDSPGQNTGVGCHLLLQFMKVKSESEVSYSCLTLHNPMNCSLPGFSIHGNFQAKVLEWIAIAFSTK